MKTGLYKWLLLPLKIKLDIFRFWCNKNLWGFNNAVILFKTLHKQSIIPVLKSNGAKIGENCDIETGLTFHNCVSFNNLVIGNNCHIGKNCFFDLRDKIEIDDNVVVSMNVCFITHIDMNKSSLRANYPAHHMPVKLDKDVYVGTGSTILMGVKVGKRAVIAAGAIVNKGVECDMVVGGVPAKIIKNR
jgi:acetyltransferase-like isoleucine patch superfamily enzyme